MVNKKIIWQSSKGEKTIYISEKSYNWVYPHKCSEFVDDAEKYSYKLATLEDYNKLIEDEKISKDRYYFIEGGLVNILGKCYLYSMNMIQFNMFLYIFTVLHLGIILS